ncbi:MAG TPA: LuxR C-terminal-related transcriptional regulator, partial [Acidimicrobiales bacterium]|nr:LuxR C-terminal-related transcriptional regulator [Acidimicrobiales bacterium]
GQHAQRVLAATTARAAAAPTPHGLVEPLSSRELDVLRLLRSDLSGPEIARELVVSLNTVRTHTKNIYTKLDVTSRRAAVRRADELGL